MNIKELNLYDLKPASYNPRKQLSPEDEEYKKISDSINNFGYVDPIIVNKDMTVIGGHQRLTVLKDLGFKVGDCVIVDIDKDKEKALNIALNKISGYWDNDKLTELLKDLNDLNMADMTGFTQPEIDNYLEELNVDKFFREENNEKKEEEPEEKECPECGCLIDIKKWEIIE